MSQVISLRALFVTAVLGAGAGLVPMVVRAEPGECEDGKRCASAGTYCTSSPLHGCEWNLIGDCHTVSPRCPDN